jgi:hypothetical protein
LSYFVVDGGSACGSCRNLRTCVNITYIILSPVQKTTFYVCIPFIQ